MDTIRMTPRQRDIDRRLLDATGLSLAAWLTGQRDERASYQTIVRDLYELTGDSISVETVRRWLDGSAA